MCVPINCDECDADAVFYLDGALSYEDRPVGWHLCRYHGFVETIDAILDGERVLDEANSCFLIALPGPDLVVVRIDVDVERVRSSRRERYRFDDMKLSVVANSLMENYRVAIAER